MKADQVRQKYIDFFTDKIRKHKQISPGPLVPPDDPTTLFTSSGMQQLVPYLKGEVHPMGTRLVDSQPCFRAEDIDEVGDNRHTTFFEMLGNWSLGDYFKKEQLSWIWEFLTTKLKLPKDKLYVTVFKGNNQVDKDIDSIKIWQDLGVDKNKISSYDASKNWWSRSGLPKNMPAGEIGGPDSEIFFEFDQVKHDPKFGQHCHPNCDCGRFLEIGNSVFIQYQKHKDGSFNLLPKQNVDFGGGLERIVAATNNNPDIFEIDLLKPLISEIEKLSGKKYESENKEPMRVVVDHIRAATMLVAEEVYPSNKMQGYILRRLIRSSIQSARNLGIEQNFIRSIVLQVSKIYKNSYPIIQKKVDTISRTLVDERNKFHKSLTKGENQLKKRWEGMKELTNRWRSLAIKGGYIPKINKAADEAFYFYQSYGFPIDVYLNVAEKEMGIFPWWFEEMAYPLDDIRKKIITKFDKLRKEHSDKSRTASAGMFKGGLADHSEITTKLHTATHIIHQALRTILGDHVSQTGSNITKERLRFDFKHPTKLTDSQKEQIESLVNKVIKQDLPVSKSIENKHDALKSGALAFFAEKYPQKVSVYTIGKDSKTNWFSRELCGGPHVSSTGKIGAVTIKKEQSVSSGTRRIYAVLKKVAN